MFDFFKRKGTGTPASDGNKGPFHHARRIDESIAEMLNVIRRVLADGVVTEEEAEALSQWTRDHPEVVEAWPGKVLAHRLEKIFADGRVDEVERADLQRLLRALAGGSWGVRDTGADNSGIPFTSPPPVLVFPEQTFVFSGEFAYGPVARCEGLVESLGGRVEGEVTRDVDVLVIGTFGTGQGGEAVESREVERAQHLRNDGYDIAIVSEDYWASALPV